MQIAIIEKGSDGFYSIRSEHKVGQYFFGGYGEDVKSAKEDFLASVKESFDGAQKEGIQIPSGIDITFRYE